jgi:hypothetical protein
MSNYEIPQTVREALHSRLTTGTSPVTGSTLGSLVYAHWPGMNKLELRSQFGSLWKFLSGLFGENIVLAGPQGADTLYSWKGREAFIPATRAKSSPADKTFWRVFTNPTLPGMLGFRSGRLSLLSKGPGELGFTPLRRMDQADNLTVVRKFIDSHIAATDKALFSGCLSGNENYWPQFSQALETPTVDYRRAWAQFRTAEIRSLFNSRCLEAGQVESEHARLWDELHSEVRAGDQTSPDGSPLGGVRELLKLALNEMTDDELAAVQIPTGVWARIKLVVR